MDAASRPPVGRDDQRSALRRAVAAVRERGAAMVLVTGDAGIGKTSLLADVAAAHDGPVRHARAADWERDRPYAVVAQLLGGSVAADDPFEVADRLVAGLADGVTTVLLVDDAHWSDRGSLEVLSVVTRHHRSRPVLVVAAARPDRASADTGDLLRRSSAPRIHLGPLAPRAVEELAADHGRPLPPWVVERLTRHTGGSPRHVLALLDELPVDVWATADLRLPPPAEVTVRVGEALAVLGPEARALVDAVAVLAQPASLAEVAGVAGLDDVLGPLEEAAGHGLVRRFGGRSIPVVGPTDPMVRAAVLDALGPRAAADGRRRAAAVVPEPSRHLAFLAAATPGPDAALAERLTDLAAEKAAEGAWRAVADAFLDAGRLTANPGQRELLLIRAVDALIGAGDVLEAGAMIPAVEDLHDTPVRNAVLGYLAILLGRASEAERRLARAWELVDPGADPDLAAWICQRRVLDALVHGRGSELVAWADRAADLVGPEAPAAVEAAAIRGLGTSAAGDPEAAVAEYRSAAARISHGAQAQRVTMGRGWLDVVVDELDDARAELESAVPTTAFGGSSRISLWALGWLARVRFLTGEWDLALRAVDQGLRLAGSTGIVLVTPLLAWTATQVHSLRGDDVRAEHAVREAEASPHDYAIMRVPHHLARAHLAELRADHGAVRRALRPLTVAPAGTTVDEPGWWPWTDVHADALVLDGSLDEADAFLTLHEQRASARHHRSTLARLGRVRGRYHAARGDLDASRAAFDASLDLFDGLPLRYDRARAHLAYGQTLRRAGKRRDADALLTVARDLFLALGARTYVDRCDRELRAGDRAERGAGDLTAQETAVADLVARGLPNKDVAAQLNVSPKTVQYHLTRIFTKLGVRSRSELAVRHGPGT